MSVSVLIAEYMMGIAGVHPEPRSVILAALADDARAKDSEDPDAELRSGG